MKQFKSESKKLLDMMINSVYTNKDIFLRELISNSSDALDKLYYKSLTTDEIKIKRESLEINIVLDKKNRTITISDNGCGMNKDELENNLGTIAKSGSFDFKENNELKKNINIIGQFGVGFYSAFMVSERVSVLSKSYDNEAYLWESSGSEGYIITKSNKDNIGTSITLYLKKDKEYDKYLEDHEIEKLVKKYSDYISYPIKLNDKVLNSMIPLWNKNKSKVTEEEYNNFYMDKFNDYNSFFRVIHYKVEGLYSYKAILFIPKVIPYDFYTKDYKKGLELYTNGVLITDKCDELLPDYFSFVKGVIDSDDLSLNISREMLQNDRKLSKIATNIENKIIKELKLFLEEDRENYALFFKEFGPQIKYGIYSNFGLNKEKLQDLLVFYSSTQKKYITLKEYVDNMKKNQQDIYYACGESIEKIDMLPLVEEVKNKKYDILYFTDGVDEFTIKTIMNYESKNFVNVCSSSLDLDTKKEQEQLDKLNKDSKEMLEFIKDELPNISKVKFTNRLKNNSVCLSTFGEISIEMEKVLSRMKGNEGINASLVLEINKNHKIVEKLNKLYTKDKEELKKYAKVLYAQAKLIEGLPLDNPVEISNIITDLISE